MKKTTTAAREEVIDVIRHALGTGDSTLHDSTTLQSLGADSLDVIEILDELESRFGLDPFDDPDVEKLATVGDVVALVEQFTAEPS